jgi:hypothetical protein
MAAMWNVGGQLVGDAARRAAQPGQPRQLLIRQRARHLRADLRETGGVIDPGLQLLRQAAHEVGDVRQLAAAKHLRVARQDLFHQARPRARHAQDEHRQLARIAEGGGPAEELRGGDGDERVDQAAVIVAVELAAALPEDLVLQVVGSLSLISALTVLGWEPAGQTVALNGVGGNLVPSPDCTIKEVPELAGEGAVATVEKAKFL